MKVKRGKANKQKRKERGECLENVFYRISNKKRNEYSCVEFIVVHCITKMEDLRKCVCKDWSFGKQALCVAMSSRGVSHSGLWWPKWKFLHCHASSEGCTWYGPSSFDQ